MLSKPIILTVAILMTLVSTQSLAQNPKERFPDKFSGQMRKSQFLVREDRLYIAQKRDFLNNNSIPEELIAAGFSRTSWAYRSDDLIQLQALDGAPSKYLAAKGTNAEDLYVAAAEKAVEAKFAKRNEEGRFVSTEGWAILTLQYELLIDGKPTGKFLGYADKSPDIAAKFKKDYELREVILVDKDQAATFRFVQDLGTSGK